MHFAFRFDHPFNKRMEFIKVGLSICYKVESIRYGIANLGWVNLIYVLYLVRYVYCQIIN